MGRAIVRNPKVFLFDEPLSNLDAKLRVQMRTEIKRVHQKVRTTTVYVTHDQVEAMTLADRVVVMNRGKIEQIGAPQRALPLADDALRRRLHRLAGDELHPLPAGGGGRRAAACGSTTRSRCRCRPSARARYRPHVGPTGSSLFGLRPEHLTEAKPNGERAPRHFERAARGRPSRWGWRRWCSSRIDGMRVCGRVNPNAGAREGGRMKLAADLDNMHLIDDATGAVL